MPPIFVILLATALGSVLASLRISQEVLRLVAGGIAVVCLIVGFAMAPWQVQLLSLVAILSWERLYGFAGVRAQK